MADDNLIQITSIKEHIKHRPSGEEYREGHARTFGDRDPNPDASGTYSFRDGKLVFTPRKEKPCQT